jgi:hypothetical protein
MHLNLVIFKSYIFRHFPLHQYQNRMILQFSVSFNLAHNHQMIDDKNQKNLIQILCYDHIMKFIEDQDPL